MQRLLEAKVKLMRSLNAMIQFLVTFNACLAPLQFQEDMLPKIL